MLFRATNETDFDRVVAYLRERPASDPLGWVDADLYLQRLGRGNYRREWTWLAEQDGRLHGLAFWYTRPSAGGPLILDHLEVSGATDRAFLAAGLLSAAHEAFRTAGSTALPEYHAFLPPGWRDDPVAVSAVGWRRKALARAGLTDELERLRYVWTPEAGIPAASSRLRFVPEPDDEIFVDAFRRVAVGRLDVETRKEIAALGPARQAREDMNVYLDMPGERSWWRLAYTPDGRLAGLAIPSRNDTVHVVGYLGVVAELRGNGYVDDLLGEITRLLAGLGANRVEADTDTTNIPMARAFERAGYRNFAIRLVICEPGRRA